MSATLEEVAAGLKPIWPDGMRIEVIGVTGDYGSGKTLFALTIDPKHTLCYDFEKSSGTYEASLGFKRISVPDILLQKHPNGYDPIDATKWVLQDVKKIRPGQYSVIVFDTISDAEVGLPALVKSEYAKYGFQSAAKFESTGGIYWNYVKEHWKAVLADIASRCQTFVFTTHLRSVWRAGRPTSEREPRGKTTLMELASLYLWLERDIPKKGDRSQNRNDDGTANGQPPAAEVLKDRLAKIVLDDEGEVKTIRRIMPPRLPVATPATIRRYISNPPDYDHLKPAEKSVPHEMTSEEKLQIEAQIAEDRRITEESALERLNKMVELRQKQDQVRTSGSMQAPVAKEAARTASHAIDLDDRKLTTDQVMKLIELVHKSGTPMENFLQVVQKLTGQEDPAKLSKEDAKKLIKRLREKVAEQQPKNQESASGTDDLPPWA